ncbi:hypothetical protein ABZ595_14540 [Streptomyces rubradiris]|uniref:hypothetical protein n=1 Tax=Streptomyces rubradiris TaxID=285531 RepID=UPI0033F4CC28
MTVHSAGRPLVHVIQLSEVETDVLYLHQCLTGGRYGLIDIGEPDGAGLTVIDHKGAHRSVFPSLVDVPEHSARRRIECANAALSSSWNPTQERDSDQTREDQSVDDLCQCGSRRVEPWAHPVDGAVTGRPARQCDDLEAPALPLPSGGGIAPGDVDVTTRLPLEDREGMDVFGGGQTREPVPGRVHADHHRGVGRGLHTGPCHPGTAEARPSSRLFPVTA